ncbi:unnamed protein product [Closterium sp. Naga37s-1]|nr:unnamed protein product [Closterium sp. Naga37s-1]
MPALPVPNSPLAFLPPRPSPLFLSALSLSPLHQLCTVFYYTDFVSSHPSDSVIGAGLLAPTTLYHKSLLSPTLLFIRFPLSPLLPLPFPSSSLSPSPLFSLFPFLPLPFLPLPFPPSPLSPLSTFPPLPFLLLPLHPPFLQLRTCFSYTDFWPTDRFCPPTTLSLSKPVGAADMAGVHKRLGEAAGCAVAMFEVRFERVRGSHAVASISCHLSVTTLTSLSRWPLMLLSLLDCITTTATLSGGNLTSRPTTPSPWLSVSRPL